MEQMSLEQIRAGDATLEQKRLEMGRLLGLGEPVSEAVLTAVIHDEGYAHNLYISQKDPAFLQYLLNHPPRMDENGRRIPYSNAELAAKASETLWRWAKTGFSSVSDDVYEKRMSVCMQCPSLIDAPDKMVYKLLTGGGVENKVCGTCGCVVARKARLTSENCPERHPHHPEFSRWGE